MLRNVWKAGRILCLAILATGTTTRAVRATELLVNGDFEAGSTGWIEDDGGTGFAVIVPSGQSLVPPQSGNYLAWLGGVNSSTTSVTQSVLVPSQATGAHVRGFVQIQTDEVLPVPFDYAEVRILGPDQTALEIVHHWTNLDASNGWVPFDFALAGNYAGQTIGFQIVASCDQVSATSFYFDTLSLDVNESTAVAEPSAITSWGTLKSRYR